MSFLSAAFLFGLAAVAVPIILHLIHRQRYPERRFTTLRFFDVTIKHNVIQRRLIDRILLALRMLALIALMLGLARLFWNGPVGDKRMSLVLVIDNSPSMSRLNGDQSLVEKARRAAARVVAGLEPSDRVELILTAPSSVLDTTMDRDAIRKALALRAGQPTGLLVDGAKGRGLSIPGLTTNLSEIAAALEKVPAGTSAALCGYGLDQELTLTYDHAQVCRRVERTGVSHQAGDLSGALQKAGGLLRRSQDGDRTIMLFTDAQQSEWPREALAEWKGLSVLVVRVEPTAKAGPNLAIEGCGVMAREAGLGQTVAGMATIRNWGREPSRECKLSVVAGPRGKPAEIKVQPIEPGAAIRVAFPVPVMSRDRNLLCTAVLESPEDAFPYDNTWHFQLGVRPPVSVLCVNGVPDATAANRESYFVMSALGLPGTPGRPETRVDVSECDVDDVEKQSLFQYRVIILAGVNRLGDGQRTRLSQFVNDGGGLLVFPGRALDPAEYNGWGFLPARVAEKRDATFAFVRSFSERAATVSELPARLGSGLSALTTRSWALLSPEPGSEVLATLGGDEPALVEKTQGRGRVILAATSCHTSGSDWPLRPAFPILLHELVRSLGAPAVPLALVPDRQVCELAASRISPELAGGTPGVFRMTQREGQVAYDGLPWYRNAGFLVLPAADEPGQFLLSVRPGTSAGLLDEPGVGASVAAVSVNHSSGEGDLTALGPDQAQARLPGARVREVSVTDDGGSLAEGLHTGRDLWRFLLVAALVFLVVESLVGWRAPSQSVG